MFRVVCCIFSGGDEDRESSTNDNIQAKRRNLQSVFVEDDAFGYYFESSKQACVQIIKHLILLS